MKKSNITAVFFTTLILALSLALFTGCGSSGSESEDSDTGSLGSISLHDFSATDFEGNGYGPEDIASRDLTMMNIWTTWCPSCVEEMPMLAELEKTLPDNVELISFCGDGDEERETADQILQEAGYEGKVVCAGEGDLLTLLNQAQFIPTTVFLDSEGNQVCEPMVGVPEDMADGYIDQINECLETLGKDPIQ